MIRFITFFFALTPLFSNAQLGQTLDKIIVSKNNIYRYTESHEKRDLFKLIEVSPRSTDTIFQYHIPDAGFEKNPICWDILERVREFYTVTGAIRFKIMVRLAKMIHVSEDNVEYS